MQRKIFSLGGGGKRGLRRGLRRNLVKSISTFSREKSVVTKVVPYDARSLNKLVVKASLTKQCKKGKSHYNIFLSHFHSKRTTYSAAAAPS